MKTLKGHEHGIMAVAALPNGDIGLFLFLFGCHLCRSNLPFLWIVSGSGEGKLVLWKMPQGNSVPLYGLLTNRKEKRKKNIFEREENRNESIHS